jgi:hypothetical protein
MRRLGPFKLVKFNEGFWSNKNPSEDFQEKEDPVITLDRKEYPDKTPHWIATIMNGPYSENEAYRITGTFNYCIKQLKDNLHKGF